MRQAGRYLPEYREVRARAGSFLDLCYRPELACEVTLQPIRRFALDGAIIFSDILVVPHALGVGLRFVEGEGPRLDPVTNAKQLGRLTRDGQRQRLAGVYEAIARTRQGLPPEVALIGFAGAPWTLACYMVEGGASRDFSRVKGWAYNDPDGFHGLIELLIEAVSDHLLAQIEAGAEAVQIFDSWAGVLPAAQFRRWCVAPVAAIVAAVKARFPDLPVIAFPRGAGINYQGYARATGVDAVSLDTTVPTDWAARVLAPDSCLQGNLDPELLVVGGDAMADATRAILDDLGQGSLVFNLGHGVLPATPPEHVAQLVRLVRRQAR